MDKTKKDIALEMLAEFEAGASRKDIGAAHGGIGESAVYFQQHFAKFLRYRAQHPAADRADVASLTEFYNHWGRTDKKAPTHTRFAQILCQLPLAANVPTKADLRSAKIAAVEAAKPPRKIARKATPAPTPEPEPAPAPAPMTKAEFESVCIPAPAPEMDPVANRRAKKTLAQRLRRAAAKAAVQWRGDEALTAAAAE